MAQPQLHIHAAFNKTRLAPTPSGYLHLGNVFSFVLTAALAQKTGAGILLRIDDYDKERTTQRYVRDVFDTLRFLKIPWDEGPEDAADFDTHYAERHRRNLYNQALHQLIESGQVFACTCSRTEILNINKDGSYPGTCTNKGLPLHTPNSALRLLTPDSIDIKINTLSGTHAETALPAPVRYFIVRKKDGSPSYQLCSLVDDVHFGIDLIVRGADLWPSTLAQLYLSAVLGEEAFQKITFLHHPLLLDDGKKMSKSEGATSVYGLRKGGKRSEDIYALLAQMLGISGEADSWQALAAAMGNQFFDAIKA